MKQTDPYVYPGTNVLINKFDCHDPDRLMEIEALSTGGNLAYLQLHQAVYDTYFLRNRQGESL